MSKSEPTVTGSGVMVGLVVLVGLVTSVGLGAFVAAGASIGKFGSYITDGEQELSTADMINKAKWIFMSYPPIIASL